MKFLISMERKLLEFHQKHPRLMFYVRMCEWLINIGGAVALFGLYIAPKIASTLGWRGAFPIGVSARLLPFALLALVVCAALTLVLKLLGQTRRYRRQKEELRAVKEHRDGLIERGLPLAQSNEMLLERNAELLAANASLLDEKAQLLATNTGLLDRSDGLRKQLRLSARCVRRFIENEKMHATLNKEILGHLEMLLAGGPTRGASVERAVGLLDARIRLELRTANEILREMAGARVVVYVTTLTRLSQDHTLEGAQAKIAYCEPETGLTRRGAFDIADETATAMILSEGHPVWICNDLAQAAADGTYHNRALEGWQKVFNSKSAVAIPALIEELGFPPSMLTANSKLANFGDRTDVLLRFFADRLGALLSMANILRGMPKSDVRTG